MAGAFLSDIATLRKRAREHIAEGAVTPGYHADRGVVIIAARGENDSTTRRLMEEILAKEEEHADDLANLLEDLGRH